MSDAELIDRLVTASRGATSDVGPAAYSEIDRTTAYRLQAGVRAALGETVAMLKTGIHADGVGVAAPIYASKVGNAPFSLSAAGAIGLEVEVGMVLGRGLPPDTIVDSAAVVRAIDHYFLGVEICGTRYRDRKAAGPNGSLADNMSGLGYAIGPRRAGSIIAGLEVRLEFVGKTIYSGPAKHAFGDVLASLVAYANSQRPEYPLKAGTIVTTGSMCGLVPASGPGHVVASLGDQSMEFDLV